MGTKGIGDRFARVAVGNGILPTGDTKISDAFLRWQKFASELTKMDTGAVLKLGVVRQLRPEEVAAYNAPFPDETYQAGPLVFPQLVPTTPDNPSSQFNRDAWTQLQAFDRPFLTLFSDSDPITAGSEKILQMRVPGARNQAHATIAQAGHFLQEDQPAAIVEHLLRFITDHPLSFVVMKGTAIDSVDAGSFGNNKSSRCIR